MLFFTSRNILVIWSHLYGVCCSRYWNNFQETRRSIWYWSQSLVPLCGRHLLHHHTPLDLLLSPANPWLYQSEAPLHLPEGGAHLHLGSHRPLHHRLHCHPGWVQLVLQQSETWWISRVRCPRGRRGKLIFTTRMSFYSRKYSTRSFTTLKLIYS